LVINYLSSVLYEILFFLILEKLLERDRFIDGESAKYLGLIDKVLEHPIQDLINQKNN